MKVTTFNDGERFVVVFEGIGVDEKDLIKGLLSPLSADNIERAPEVAPVPVEEDEEPVIPIVFPDGPYAGMSPTDILAAGPQEAQDAYVYICSVIENLTDDLREICDAETKKYVKSRFENTNSQEYAKKLSDNLVNKFFDMFAYSIPKELKVEPWTRNSVASAIDYFQAFY